MLVYSGVWKEIYYRLDVCRITNGAHIQIKEVATKTLRIFSCIIRDFHGWQQKSWLSGLLHCVVG